MMLGCMMPWTEMRQRINHAPGVYCFKHLHSGRCYVGSSNNIHKRVRTHLYLLNTGKHSNDFLQAAWSKYGAFAFTFRVLEYTLNIREREQYYIDQFSAASTKNGFNLHADVYGYHPSARTRAKISAAGKARPPRSQETCEKLRQAMLGPSHPFRGRKLSAAHLAKISAKHHARGSQKKIAKGVNLDARTKTFMARIYVNRKQVFLGRYATEAEAATAYNRAALKYFGPTAYLNPVPEVEPKRNHRKGRTPR